MSKVITFSRVFPSYHPRAGEPTYFVEKVWESIYLTGDNPTWMGEHYTEITNKVPGLKNIGLHKVYDPKHHTIRAGHRWKVGDWFGPRVWSGKPYNSKQIQFAPDIQVKKVWDFHVSNSKLFIENSPFTIHSVIVDELAKNDGLSTQDLKDWFQYPKPFSGQIICWNESIEY